MQSTTRFLTVGLLLAAGAIAQTTLVLPGEYDRGWGRGSSAALGGNTTRTQMVFVNPFPIGTLVHGIGLRSTTGTTDRAAFTADCEVLISSTPAVPGAFSTTFATNHGTDLAIAMPRQFVNIPAMPANRGTGTFAQLMFPAPFTFGTNGQTNINVELIVYSRSTSASFSTDRAFTTTGGRAINTGTGCGTGTITSTNVGGYLAGATVNISLANTPPNGTALLMYSFDQKEFAPGVPLPVSLSVINSAANCNLFLNPSEGFTQMPTDAVGAVTASFVIPAFIVQVGVGVQYGYLVPPSGVNPFGLEVTNNRTIWFGPEVCWPTSGYVYDLFSTTALTGTASTNAVPVVQFVIQ